jgi:hypothetical protein
METFLMDFRLNKIRKSNTNPITGGIKRETNPRNKIITDRNPIPINSEISKISIGSSNNSLHDDNKWNPKEAHINNKNITRNRLYKLSKIKNKPLYCKP